MTESIAATHPLSHIYGNRIYDGAAAYAGTPSLLHDESNRLAEVRDSASGFASLATYRYDAFGRRTKKTTPDATILFFYDTQGHRVEEIRKVAGASNDIVRSYVFLEVELVGLVDDTVEVGTAAWLAPLGLPRELELPLALLALLLGAGLRQVIEIVWYPFGPRQQAKLPPLGAGVNTVTSTRGVNLRGQVTDVVVTSGATPILDRQYTYDFTAGAPGPSDPGPNLDRLVDALDATESRFYFYDALDRLQQARRGIDRFTTTKS